MSTILFFVSLCSSMLVFNIIFISGIENSNANKHHDAISASNQMLTSDEEGPPENVWCTVVAALLHYFLLATFVWTALNSVQLYLLLIKTQLRFPRFYSTVMSLTRWGKSEYPSHFSGLPFCAYNNNDAARPNFGSGMAQNCSSFKEGGGKDAPMTTESMLQNLLQCY